MEYADILTDKNVLELEYLPYLDNINRDYVDEFDLILLRNKKGYYDDEINYNNYILDEKRYINEDDIKNILKARYSANDILYDKLTLQLNLMKDYYTSVLDFKNADMYKGYEYKVGVTIKNENKRLMDYINLYESTDTNTYKNVNIYYLIYLLVFLIFYFVYFFFTSSYI